MWITICTFMKIKIKNIYKKTGEDLTHNKYSLFLFPCFHSDK